MSIAPLTRIPMKFIQFVVYVVILPLVGVGATLLIWTITSASFSETLPSPAQAWEESRLYIT